ncbi:MAG: hypothetical protein KF868_01785, partial [Acidobacteria bacterium]|nr:hypothetical protein [Acidobacteriota bacterium]
GTLLRKLNERPAGLEERDEPFLQQVSERLKLIMDRDVVTRIVEEFKSLQTAEQRAECLVRMVGLYQADGMPDELASRLVAILETGAAV